METIAFLSGIVGCGLLIYYFYLLVKGDKQ